MSLTEVIKTKNFDLFSEGCDFTDDSVMTIAVGEALLAVGPVLPVKTVKYRKPACRRI